VGKSILIVDDNLHTRTAIRSLLEAQTPFKVCAEAADGDDALEKARHLKPDLVVLDFVMPRMNGVEVAQELRATGATVPIILFSWHADVIPRELVQRLGLELVSKNDYAGLLVQKTMTLLGAA
jgi:CheY-like chemotaxis protein